MSKLILFGTYRHAISINDYYMFFSRTSHKIVKIYFPRDQVVAREWWDAGKRVDKARDSIVDLIEKSLPSIYEWNDLKTVIAEMKEIEWDYCLLGNGNSVDQKKLIDTFGVEKFLFSEYGWLPWSSHFYISRLGSGFDSEIAKASKNDLNKIQIRNEEIKDFHRSLDKGISCNFGNFIYVPMQKDVNDFKFDFTRFESNLEFLQSIEEYIPHDLTILVKRHPLYPVKYDLSFSDRMVDITHWNINKHEIYQKMKAMACINSTSILEGLSYGKKVFAYGEDIYLNKGLVEFDVSSRESFEMKLAEETDSELCLRFVSLLFERQINRHRCVAGDTKYLEGHYWNLNL